MVYRSSLSIGLDSRCKSRRSVRFGSVRFGSTGMLVSRILSIAALCGLMVLTTACLVLSTRQMHIQQSEIEEQTRKVIGTWLRQNAKAGDTVYAECLGYIGYYFGGKMLDYPGLVSPEVVAARRQHQDDLAVVPVFVKPTWIVARQSEAEKILSIEANKTAYEIVGKFDARERLAKYGQFPGKMALETDSLFFVLKRK
jgi:hypothetical protein